MKGNNCFFYILFSILLIMLFLLGNFYYIINKQNKKIGDDIENFDDFSPYQGNSANSCMFQDKKSDAARLAKALEQWERPYNGNTYGYVNMQPGGLPPLVPITSYPVMIDRENYGPDDEKRITYTDVFSKDDGQFIGYKMSLHDK